MLARLVFALAAAASAVSAFEILAPNSATWWGPFTQSLPSTPIFFSFLIQSLNPKMSLPGRVPLRMHLLVDSPSCELFSHRCIRPC